MKSLTRLLWKRKAATVAAVLAALSVAAISSPSYALTFHFSFTDGIGTVTGEIDGLTAGGTGQAAAHVFINSAPFSVGFQLPYDTINDIFKNTFDVNASGQITSYNYGAAIFAGDGNGYVYDLCFGGPCSYHGDPALGVFLSSGSTVDGPRIVTSSITFTSDAPVATPLPAALPLFASGLGALGLLTWRRKRKAVRSFFRKFQTGIFALLGAWALSCGHANASMIGATISVSAEGPLGTPLGCSPDCFSFGTFVVGAGIETSRIFPGGAILYDVNFGSNSLILTYQNPATATISPFQGVVFSILSGDPFGPILSVSGIASAKVFLTGGHLAINFFPETFNIGNQIEVTFGQTPIPGALPLFATGLGALGLLTWRRKRKAVAA